MKPVDGGFGAKTDGNWNGMLGMLFRKVSTYFYSDISGAVCI